MNSQPVLLDLFCCAGGAAKGYQHAGFYVVGVDRDPQPNYCGDEFVRADAIDYLTQLVGSDDGRPARFAAVHASPPCQRYSSLTKRHGAPDAHPDLLAPVRDMLRLWDHMWGIPWAIENVVGAPLISPVTLCGSMFGLSSHVDGERRQLRRHRLFESNVPLMAGGCSHVGERTIGVYGKPGGSSTRDGVRFGDAATWREAMDIDWMTAREMAQAIPPAYTHFIGSQIMAHIEAQEVCRAAA